MNAIFLTGFMATGKSAVGRALAERLGRPFIDTDQEIERAVGATIPAIFRDRGQAEFRRLEREALGRAAAVDGAVIATGGGLPMDPENRRRMRGAGRIVCLTAAVETVLSRAGGGDDRPLLAGAVDRAARVRELLALRADAYADADWTVDTSSAPAATIAERIAGWHAAGSAGSKQ